MKINSMLFLIVGVCPISFMAAEPDANKEELKKLQGTWLIERIEEDGKKAEDFQKNMVMKVEGNTMSIIAGNGDVLRKAILVVDARKSPKLWDIEEDRKPHLGIYKLEGDTLTICTTTSSTRPTEFKSDKKISMATMTRKKD